MPSFVDTMRLKGMAEEDIYFARRDRELIAALRAKRLPRKPVPDATAAPTTPNPAAHNQKLPE
jgi:hypothetical protein